MQGGVKIKPMSQSRWCHRQGAVTIKAASRSKWCHSKGGVTVKEGWAVSEGYFDAAVAEGGGGAVALTRDYHIL